MIMSVTLPSLIRAFLFIGLELQNHNHSRTPVAACDWRPERLRAAAARTISLPWIASAVREAAFHPAHAAAAQERRAADAANYSSSLFRSAAAIAARTVQRSKDRLSAAAANIASPAVAAAARSIGSERCGSAGAAITHNCASAA